MTRRRPITRWFSRFRHSRGFGVHSPFAFSFITQTLRDKSSNYYLYPALDYNGGDNTDTLKLLLRVLCRLHPASVRVIPRAGNDVITDIVKEVDSTTSINQAESPELIITNDIPDKDRDLLVKCLACGGSVFFFNNEETAWDIVETMTHGMTFSNGRILIAVGRRDLPRQHFELYF